MPNARPAPQPAIAFVQIAFLPTILSVTHSRAVYAATIRFRKMISTSKQSKISSRTLTFQVCKTHGSLKLLLTSKMKNDLFHYRRFHCRILNSGSGHHRTRHLTQGTHEETKNSAHTSSYMLICTVNKIHITPPKMNLIKQELFTSFRFFGYIDISIYLLSLLQKEEVLDGRLNNKSNGFFVGNFINRREESIVRFLL